MKNKTVGLLEVDPINFEIIASFSPLEKGFCHVVTIVNMLLLKLSKLPYRTKKFWTQVKKFFRSDE